MKAAKIACCNTDFACCTQATRKNDRAAMAVGRRRCSSSRHSSLKLMLLVLALLPTCGCVKSAATSYDHQVKLITSGNFHIILEMVKNKESGVVFALATVVPKDQEAYSRLDYSFEDSQFVMDGNGFVDLSSRSCMIVTLPNGLSHEVGISRNATLDETQQALERVLEDWETGI